MPDLFLLSHQYGILSGDSLRQEWQLLVADIAYGSSEPLKESLTAFIDEHQSYEWQELFLETAIQKANIVLAQYLITRACRHVQPQTSCLKQLNFPRNCQRSGLTPIEEKSRLITCFLEKINTYLAQSSAAPEEFLAATSAIARDLQRSCDSIRSKKNLTTS